MQEFFINIISNYGYVGVFLLILIENIFPPIPSEVILLVTGFFTVSSNISIFGVIISATLASLLGAYLLYYLGNIINEDRLLKIVNSKIGKCLHLKEKDVKNTIECFNGRGQLSIFIGRCIPIIRSLISVPAGIGKMNIIKFSIYTICGSLIWNTLLVCLGTSLKNNWPIVLKFLSIYKKYVIIILGFLVIVFIIKKLWKNHK